MVLRRVFENTADLVTGKLQPNWEGPYVIIRVGPARSYALNKLDGGTRAPECGILCNLKGIISKAFFKGVINKSSS